MDEQYLADVRQYLQDQGVRFEPGLTDAEIQEIQNRYEFVFPPDLRQWLQFAYPIAKDFPDWRWGTEASLRWRLDFPADGICFDIVHDGFWLKTWGVAPASMEEACAVARRHISAMPRLIPIYSHRFISDEPSATGNPVFSIVQSDIVLYGLDLRDYFQYEFGVPNPYPIPDKPRSIRGWSPLLDHFFRYPAGSG